MGIFNIFRQFTLKWPWWDHEMTLVLCTSGAQLIICSKAKILLVSSDKSGIAKYSDFCQNPSPGIQRWECKCIQEFSVNRVKAIYNVVRNWKMQTVTTSCIHKAWSPTKRIHISKERFKINHMMHILFFSLNPFVTSPGDVRNLGRPLITGQRHKIHVFNGLR